MLIQTSKYQEGIVKCIEVERCSSILIMLFQSFLDFKLKQAVQNKVANLVAKWWIFLQHLITMQRCTKVNHLQMVDFFHVHVLQFAYE